MRTSDLRALADAGQSPTSAWKLEYKLAMGVTALLYGLAAYFSRGYFHYDEHFQTLEFASYLMGRTAAADLPWEFQQQLRPWLQPVLYWMVFKGAQGLGVTDTFTWAFLARLVSAACGWLGAALLAWRCRDWFPEGPGRRLALWSMPLMFYLPFLHARTSSENLAGSLLLVALALVPGKEKPKAGLKNYAAVGLFLGLAFGMRYQVAFMVLGLGAWCLLIDRLRFPAIAAMLTGFCAALAVETWLDAVCYGSWTFVPWNYFKANIIDGVAANYGRSPWWYWGVLFWQDAGNPLTFMLLAGVLASWMLLPKHILTWTTLPFVAVHVVLAHKETRFLFPAAMLAPMQCLLVWQYWRDHRREHNAAAETGSRRQRLWVWRTVMVVNGVALLKLTFVPPLEIYSAFSAIKSEVPISVPLYAEEDDPFILASLNASFYRPPGLQVKVVPSLAELGTRSLAGEGDFYAFRTAAAYSPRVEVPGLECTVLYSGKVLPLLPDVEILASFRGRFHAHQLLRCHRAGWRGRPDAGNAL